MKTENGMHFGFLGERVKHVSHGIEGDVVAIHTTLGGETTLCVEHVTKSGSVERDWFNYVQLAVVPKKTVKKSVKVSASSARRTVAKNAPRLGR